MNLIMLIIGIVLTVIGAKRLRSGHSIALLAIGIVITVAGVGWFTSVFINTYPKYATRSNTQLEGKGRFIAYGNGTVLDTRTNLMWAAKDNGSDINWANAKSYCENYRGGGYTDWRMPTLDELAGLYDAAKTYMSNCGYNVHLTELIHFTCCCLWASETRGSDAAAFGFDTGDRGWGPQSLFNYARALPVRSGK